MFSLPFRPVSPISRSARNISGHHPPTNPTPDPPSSLSLSLFALGSADASRKLLQHFVNCHFATQHPLHATPGTRHPLLPAKRLLFLVFWLISCDSFRFVSFTLTLLPSTPALIHLLLFSISHFSHFVAYCVAFCASLFVHFPFLSGNGAMYH